MNKATVLIIPLLAVLILGINPALASEEKTEGAQKKAAGAEARPLAPTNRAKTMNRNEAQDMAARSQMIKDLERELGKPLSREQQQQILAVVRANAEIARAMHQIFLRSIGNLFDLKGKELRDVGIESLKEGLDLEKDVIQKVEKKVGRKLNQVERKVIVDLNDLREYNARKVHENISTSVAMITGIPQKRVMQIIPPVGIGRRK